MCITSSVIPNRVEVEKKIVGMCTVRRSYTVTLTARHTRHTEFDSESLPGLSLPKKLSYIAL